MNYRSTRSVIAVLYIFASYRKWERERYEWIKTYHILLSGSSVGNTVIYNTTSWPPLFDNNIALISKRERRGWKIENSRPACLFFFRSRSGFLCISIRRWRPSWASLPHPCKGKYYIKLSLGNQSVCHTFCPFPLPPSGPWGPPCCWGPSCHRSRWSRWSRGTRWPTIKIQIWLNFKNIFIWVKCLFYFVLHLCHVGVLVRPRAHDGLGLLARHALLPGFRAKGIYYFPHKYGKCQTVWIFIIFLLSLPPLNVLPQGRQCRRQLLQFFWNIPFFFKKKFFLPNTSAQSTYLYPDDRLCLPGDKVHNLVLVPPLRQLALHLLVGLDDDRDLRFEFEFSKLIFGEVA